MKKFVDCNLPKSLESAISQMGLNELTPIQEKAFSPILSGRNVLGIAQTGTGKTLAYLVPLLKQWQFQGKDSPTIIILVPTRELVVQLVEVIEKLTQKIAIRTAGIYGGTNINTQKKAITQGVDLLVGTPGRMMDLALDGILRFDHVKKLVIDEFDEILGLGFKTQITAILTMMNSKEQSILFSATMTDTVDLMIESFFETPLEVSLAKSGTPLQSIDQKIFQAPNFLTKINLLKHLLNQNDTFKKILIFINHKQLSELVYEALIDIYPDKFDLLHSNKSQNYRLNALKKFQDETIIGLITTDVMARGLDIQHVSHVINLQLPDSPENYIHRIGRTARAGQKGEAISIVAPYEEQQLLEIELLMNLELPICPLEGSIEIEEKKLDFEKKHKKSANRTKKEVTKKGAAFHQKKQKNKKINLGGPGKRKPKKTKSRNRAVERKRAQKRKGK